MSHSTTPSSTRIPAHTYAQVDPATVQIGSNVRLDARIDKPFLASVRERGVLEPVLLYRGEDGTLTVLAGQRRTLAAQQTGQATIPALIADTPPADADRLVDQWVENEHRAALTTSERITAVEQMTLAGLSEHQIAKRTATPKAAVAAAKAAAAATGELRELTDQLSLDQAATLAEFEDDPEAVEALLDAARTGRFDHIAQRLRNDRADAAARAAYAEQITAAGITLVERPDHRSPVTSLRGLTDADGHPLTAENHAACPGHAAYISSTWRQPDQLSNTDCTLTDPDELDDVDDELDDELDDDVEDQDQDEKQSACQPPVEVLVTEWVCLDPAAHGHLDRWRSAPVEPARKRAADMDDAEREQARADRRHVIESNKAWKAATEVRRTWLATVFAVRKTAPAGAEAYLARTLVEGWSREAASSDVLALAGYSPTSHQTGPTSQLSPASWALAYELRQTVVDSLDHASPKRALQVALVLAVAAWETHTQPQTWRSPDAQTFHTLACLKTWGYPLSEIEDRILTDAADRTARDAADDGEQAQDADQDADQDVDQDVDQDGQIAGQEL